MTINPCTILDRIRKCSLWAFLTTAAVVLLIEILEVWNAIDTQTVRRMRAPEINAWGKVENTASIIMVISLLVLLALLIANRAKGDVAKAMTSGSTAKKAGTKK